MLYRQHPFGSDKTQYRKKRRVVVQKKFGVLDEIIDRSLVFNPEDRIGWSELLDLFVRYRNNKERYENAEKFPIQAESIIYGDSMSIREEKSYCFRKKKKIAE
jgi:hypothetical protein